MLVALFALACRSTPDTTTKDAVDTESTDPCVANDADCYGPEDGDCDDDDATVNPAALEACDGIDNDCDDEVDEGVTTTFFRDTDSDGFGDGAAEVQACELPSGAVTNADDCDDTNASVYPGNPEVCDGLDNNCDGAVDEGVAGVWYADADGDAHGDPDAPYFACTQPEGSVDDATDCDDTTALAHPGADEVCDEVDNDCDGEVDEGVGTTYWADTDGDGWGEDGATDLSCALPTGYAEEPGDCDDLDPDVFPGATEWCNGIDDDCDGDTDEGAADADTWYADADADGYGDPTSTAASCDAPAGFVANDEDCDDTDASVNPTTTWYYDADADGFGGAVPSITQCAAPAGWLRDGSDCDDACADCYPGGTEVCDELDNDCDGSADEGLSTGTWYADADGDGYGDASVATSACAQPAGTVADATDCDDATASVNPAAAEDCTNGIDDDCDGDVDEDDADCVVDVHVSADTDNYSLYDTLGAPSTSVNIRLIVDPGVTVGSTDPGTPALTTGALPTGSTLQIVNYGTVHGAGGDGACGYGGDGEDGGDAIELLVDATIDNTAGAIYGGGGGGGAGDDPAGGGGGAGGGLGCDGGSDSSGGYGGDGPTRWGTIAGGDPTLYDGSAGTGGAWGNPGSNGGGGSGGQAGTMVFTGCCAGQGGAGGGWGGGGGGGTAWEVSRTPGSGGDAGYAVRETGGVVTWAGGYNLAQVKGSVGP